jgi:hypothetical protein
MTAKKKYTKKTVKHHVIAKNVQPKHVAALIAPSDPAIIAKEPHVVVAIPKTFWERIVDFLR